jgi:hypothetical protein
MISDREVPANALFLRLSMTISFGRGGKIKDQPGERGSSGSPWSPLFRTWIMRGGLDDSMTALRAEASNVERLGYTTDEAGTPIGGGWSMASWMSRRRRTRCGGLGVVEDGLDDVEGLPLSMVVMGYASVEQICKNSVNGTL